MKSFFGGQSNTAVGITVANNALENYNENVKFVQPRPELAEPALGVPERSFSSAHPPFCC
jgi:hypothetical protein